MKGNSSFCEDVIAVDPTVTLEVALPIRKLNVIIRVRNNPNPKVRGLEVTQSEG